MNKTSEQNFYIKQIFKLIAVIALLTGAFISQVNAQEKLPVERYAVYVASNNGGPSREVLRYAGTDAKRLANTMMDIGGVKPENSTILIDPPKADIDKTLSSLSKKIEANKNLSKRTEFIFYYSGHSDENALLLGTESYDYSTLKAAISNVPSDVHVVMLDSCFSGNFIRAKGGQRQKSFLIDDSTVVQGHAYLSSSSDTEASQESDTIQASFFTHAMVTGLRGAADASGDSKVSLNELYHYAFNETLSQTERSTIGPQHPSYNITLVGSGDLVLTDITEAESVLVIPAESEGKYFIRTFDGILVSEVNKIKGNKVALALSEGYYSVTLIIGTVTQQSTVSLKAGQQYVLSGVDFMPVQTISGRARGGTAENQLDITTAEPEVTQVETEPELKQIEKSPSLIQDPKTLETAKPVEDELEAIRRQALAEIRRIQGKSVPAAAASAERVNTADTTVRNAAGITYDYSSDETYIEDSPRYSSPVPSKENSELKWSLFSFGLFPGVGLPMPIPENVHVSISLFMANNKNIFGAQAAGFMGISSESVSGIQASGFMNITGVLRGVQAASFMNISKEVYGVQASSFANIATTVKGVQATGFLNVASGKTKGAQISGFLNIADEIDGVQIGVINIAKKNSGAAIGVLNFIKDGIMSPGVYWERGNNLMFQYQGGTSSFFTTFMAGFPLVTDKNYYITGAGIGVRLGADEKINIDIEALYKTIHPVTYGPDSITATDKWEDQIPSLRLTLNLGMFDHLIAFVSLSNDIMIESWNKRAFSYWEHDKGFGASDNSFTIYPTVSFGLKF